MGEGQEGSLKLHFDGHLRLEFRGAKVTTDAGLLVVRELDEVLGLTEMAGEKISDNRTGRNVQHELAGLLRQSVYARLAGYEDVNDQEALTRDPAMRAVVGKKALDRNAASSQTVSRFETETLATEQNIEALSSINAVWVEKAIARTNTKKIVLDLSLIHISEPTRLLSISYAVFCLLLSISYAVFCLILNISYAVFCLILNISYTD